MEAGLECQKHLSPWKSSLKVVNATWQLSTCVINATFPLADRIVNMACQLSSRVDLEILKVAKSFEKWLMIGSIPDILDGKFEEYAIWITPSYPLPYHLSPISTSHFMEERERNLKIWEQSYAFGLIIKARGKEDQGAITFNNPFVISWYMKEYMCFPL